MGVPHHIHARGGALPRWSRCRSQPGFACLVLLLLACGPVADATAAGPDFVGRKVCVPCHTRQAVQYKASHHDRAMQPAHARTVLGNFDNATFTYHDVTSTFSRKGDDYYVRTDGPDGKLHDYRIAYTFGVYPLQQYLIEFPGGRLQALNVCWDMRPKAQGGQRWFHLYPDENVTHEDILHWTGPYQNWNHMCAECHSTNVRKNYDPDTGTFATTWSEIDVSCEACHGPGSEHVAWADAVKQDPSRAAESSKGLAVEFGDSGTWVLDPEAGIAKRSQPRKSHVETEICARCHARRGKLSEDYVFGGSLLDTHRPALLEAVLYEHDGQIKDEVFEHQSFLQSKMHAAGVTCTNCHNPHSLKTVSGNAACSRCHLREKFDTPKHHFHKQDGKGARCVACHMPTKNYMVVHARHDHSLRVPRPDLTVKIGTPNACTPCHKDQSPQWAANAALKWWGTEQRSQPHYGETLHLGHRNLPGAEKALVALADDTTKPHIVRATAVELLTTHLSPRSGPTLERALRDENPLMRMAAVAALRYSEPRLRARFLSPLLDDPVRTVRIDAGRALATVPAAMLPPDKQAAARRALDEFVQAQMLDADRAEAHLNLGALYAEVGRLADAAREYRIALTLSPRFSVTYLNLADLYRQQSRDTEGERVLREGLAVAPNDARLVHALGLLLVRQKRSAEALLLLEKAVTLAPDEPRYAYVYAVGLHSSGQKPKALGVLKKTHEAHPGDRDVLEALVLFHRDAGDLQAASKYAETLAANVPDDPGVQQLREQIEALLLATKKAAGD
jgi:Flp pilus assembly protein TadD